MFKGEFVLVKDLYHCCVVCYIFFNTLKCLDLVTYRRTYPSYRVAALLEKKCLDILHVSNLSDIQAEPANFTVPKTKFFKVFNSLHKHKDKKNKKKINIQT